MRATLLTKGVYTILAFLSISAWAIIIRKVLLLRRCRKGSQNFMKLYRKGRRNPLALYRHLLVNRDRFPSPLTAVYLGGCEELQGQLDKHRPRQQKADEAESGTITPGQLDVIRQAIETVQDRYFVALERLLIHLATTISVAPFLGLLGTVWGILVAFQSMGEQGSTGVTAFGPGISEALISTVSGLIVAIPALLGYNFIGARIRELASETSGFATDFMTLIAKEFVQD